MSMMKRTRLRSVAHTSGTVIAKLPDPPRRAFPGMGAERPLVVTALSLSVDDGRSWVRGWQFLLGNSSMPLYIDASELAQIASLAGKSADDRARMGYEYRTQEEVIFETMQSKQRISASPVFGFRLEGPTVVDDVVAFMTSSAAPWNDAK